MNHRILDSIPNPIFVKNEHLVYTHCNKAFLEFIGKKREEVLGKGVHEVSPKEKADIYYKQDMDLIHSKEVQIYETKVRYSDGSDRDVIFHKALIFDEKNNIKGIAGIITDITERKKIEKEKEEIQKTLLHQEKLATIGTLASGVVHEINNPLSAALGYIGYLKKDLRKPNYNKEDPFLESLEKLEKVEKACLKISTIIKGLSLYSRKDEEEMGPVDIHQGISESCDMLKEILAKGGVEIVSQLKASQPFILGNRGKFQQIIVNVLTNARDAIKELKEEGRIFIETNDLENSPYLEILIRDEGIGMTEEIKAKIFDAFYTTKEWGKGTGLGMFISKQIIESFGGQIQIESKKNEGSSIRLIFKKHIMHTS